MHISLRTARVRLDEDNMGIYQTIEYDLFGARLDTQELHYEEPIQQEYLPSETTLLPFRLLLFLQLLLLRPLLLLPLQYGKRNQGPISFAVESARCMRIVAHDFVDNMAAHCGGTMS